MKNKYLINLSLIIALIFSFNSLNAQYCATLNSGSACISNVTFNSINNTTGCINTTSNYSLETATTAVIQGTTHTFTITTNASAIVSVWFDWNHDFTFSPSEWYQPFTTGTTGSSIVNVPIGAIPGTTRMRVRSRLVNNPNGSGDACLQMFSGETEDYDITVVAATPCSGTPTAGVTTASNTNPCPGVTTTMNLVGSSLVGNLGYQWLQSSTGAGGPWSAIPGAGNFSFSTVVTGAKCYRCKVTCLNSGMVDTSTAVCVTAQTWTPVSACYCIPTYTGTNANNIVTNVNLGNLTNNTLAAGNPTPHWVDYTSSQSGSSASLPIPSIYKGLSTNISIEMGASTTNYSAVWIDYDHNGIFDTTEYNSTGLNAGANGTSIIGFTPPISALTGITRMRIRGAGTAQMLKTQACGATVSTLGEAEDYLVNIINPAAQDPTVTAIAGPSLNCFTTCETVTATVSNYGSLPINVLSNPINVTLHVNGPNGVTTYTQAVTAATLNAYAGNSTPVVFPCVDMYGGGLYSLNTTLTMGNAGGAVNGIVMNDSLLSGPIFGNYRPVPGADMHICKDAPIGIGQGLLVSGCGNTIYDSVEIVFNVTPTPDNVGATSSGTSQTVPGAAAANEFAGNFANAIMPALPTSNPIFTQNAVMTVTNFASSFPTEPRFVLYKGPNNPIPNPTANANPTSMIFNPCTQGYNVNAGNITLAGQSSLMSAGVYKNTRHITPAQISNLFSNLPAGQTLNVGYFETWNDNMSTSDITPNAGGNLTTVKLKIYYSYIPSKINWYDNLTSTTVLDTIAPYNPLLPTPGYPATTQLSNTSVPGTYTFYATCDGPDCRVPVNLIIDPSPSAFQDTVSLCEDAPGSNQAIFYLCGISGPVSGYASGVTVSYYQDQSLISLLQYCYDTTSTAYIYSKVLNSTTGCYGTDSVLLQATPLPEFSSPVYTGTACAPATFDVANALYFSNVPTGTDTLYFEDMVCTIPHLNPHAIAVADTVYVVFKTNTTPACTDTAVAYIDISPAQNLIASQAPGNYSFQGPIPPVTYNFLDGVSNTYYQSSDCKKVAMITDVTNGISLGSTIVNEDINNGALDHNGQPYANRVYQITPTTQDSAQVCLYYLQDDIDTYNGAPLAGLYPTLDATTFCITKTDNGDVNTPGHTFTVIPNSAITSSYDAATTVWTLCFMVDSFSYFYLHTQNPNNVALPISLLSFTGKRVENTSLLKWSTTAEQNNAYFEIERSKDARNFNVVSDKIATKATNGNSNTTLNYSFTDMIPNEGHNYYRLKQTDKDGKTSNAKNVVDVYFGDETMVTLYPNPAQSELNIDINISKATNAKMKIMDATGRVVKQIEMQLKSGGNQTKVSLDGLSDGMYMVNITNEKGLNYSQTIRKN